MAELTARERLLPCLLDRLTDDRPQAVGAAVSGSGAGATGRGRDVRDDRFVMSPSEMRKRLRRDVEWLLNTTRKFREGELDAYPNVARSVLNFGIPDLCGVTASSISAQGLEKQIVDAMSVFEPRIVRRLSVKVEVDSDEMTVNSLGLEVRGEMWSVPVPESLYFRSEVDLETGKAQVVDGGNG